jgi:hypothetical protein
MMSEEEAMSTMPRLSLMRLEKTTQFAPLAILGAYIRQHDLISPILARVKFSKRLHTETPTLALIDLWISILAGCRSVSQVNTKIRPEHLLAKAWGREQFCEQSTLARILDACEEEQVDQLRAGVESISRWIGRAAQHSWEKAPLMIDIDLTGLPAGRDAEGSTKGYFSGKRGREVASCVVLERLTMTRASVRCSILAIN